MGGGKLEYEGPGRWAWAVGDGLCWLGEDVAGGVAAGRSAGVVLASPSRRRRLLLVGVVGVVGVVLLLCATAALGLPPRPRNLLGLERGGVVEAVAEEEEGASDWYRVGRVVDVDGDVDADGGVEDNVDLRPRNRAEVEGVAGAPAPEAVEAEPIGGIGTTRTTAFPAPSSPPDRIETGGRAHTAIPWRGQGVPRQKHAVGSGGHWALEGAGDARPELLRDSVQCRTRESDKQPGPSVVTNGPILELFGTLSNLVPMDSLSTTTAHLLSSSRPLGYGILGRDSPPSCWSDDDGAGNGCKGLRGRTGLVSCSCVRSCESANIGVPPSTKAFRAAWPQSSISGVRRGGKCYYLTVVIGATVGFAVRETAPAGMTHDDGFGWLRPRWFQLARRANSRPWLSRFMDRCRGSPWAAVPVCSS